MDDSIFATLLLPVALGVIMLSLGLSLTPADFKRVVVFPKGVAIGLSNLFVVSPLLAFGVAEALWARPRAGRRARDPRRLAGWRDGEHAHPPRARRHGALDHPDRALSITLTAISSAAAVITVPLFLELATNHFGARGFDDVGVAAIVLRVLLITVVPLSIGMYLRRRSPERVTATEPRVRKLALALFVLIVIGAVIAEHERVLDNLGEVALAAITLNVAAMAVSFSLSRLARLDDRQTTAVAIELGIHNATLAIAVAATISTVLTIPAAVYSAFMFITAGLFARAMARRNPPVTGAEASTG